MENWDFKFNFSIVVENTVIYPGFYIVKRTFWVNVAKPCIFIDPLNYIMK